MTEIFTRKGAVRGNHVHANTTQWTYIAWGALLIATQPDDVTHTQECGPGQLILEAPGIPHAWKALKDTKVLVFTCGPRSGEAYESDTVRLKEPLL